ncbi:hypothetical protein ACC731_38060, partial [Rhizobium ruizarguesonis]
AIAPVNGDLKAGLDALSDKDPQLVLSPGSGDATLPHAAAMKPKADRIRKAFFIRDLAMKTRPDIRLEAS